jgi:hypothetical protein
LAHGGNPYTIDEETYKQICVMYSDGLIGNKGILEVLGNLTAGVYNYMRTSGQAPYKLQDIIKKSYFYIYPQDNINSASDSLLLFMTQAPNFDMKKFKG